MTLDVQPVDERTPVSGRDRFGELLRSPYFGQVVSANRLYLTAAVADALAGEGRCWALSCLPTTGRGDRFSTLSMGGQETFAVFKPSGDGIVTAHVFVSESVLESFGDGLDGRDLQVLPSPYVSGGDDQVEVFGTWDALARALAGPALRRAARDFAERLLPTTTKYWRFHDEELAGRVLGRS